MALRRPKTRDLDRGPRQIPALSAPGTRDGEPVEWDLIGPARDWDDPGASERASEGLDGDVVVLNVEDVKLLRDIRWRAHSDRRTALASFVASVPEVSIQWPTSDQIDAAYGPHRHTPHAAKVCELTDVILRIDEHLQRAAENGAELLVPRCLN